MLLILEHVEPNHPYCAEEEAFGSELLRIPNRIIIRFRHDPMWLEPLSFKFLLYGSWLAW